jgi:hypothetical protein
MSNHSRGLWGYGGEPLEDEALAEATLRMGRATATGLDLN